MQTSCTNYIKALLRQILNHGGFQHWGNLLGRKQCSAPKALFRSQGLMAWYKTNISKWGWVPDKQAKVIIKDQGLFPISLSLLALGGEKKQKKKKRSILLKPLWVKLFKKKMYLLKQSPWNDIWKHIFKIHHFQILIWLLIIKFKIDSGLFLGGKKSKTRERNHFFSLIC